MYNRQLRRHNAYIPLDVQITSTPVFPHGIDGIFISSGAKIGSGCTIFQQVTIGSNTLEGTRHSGAPSIGDNVLIGAGARIIGGVHIGSNVCIGAGCIVTDDVPDNCSVVMPKPRVIAHEHERTIKFLSWKEYCDMVHNNKESEE